MNDCGINKKNDIENVRKHINDIDVFLTQFSYGQYEGNENEPRKKIKAIIKKILIIKIL